VVLPAVVGAVGWVSEHRGAKAKLVAVADGPVGGWRRSVAQRSSWTQQWLWKLSLAPLLDSRMRAPVCSRRKVVWGSLAGGRRRGGAARVYGG
jgi:hypothetical protein